MAGESSQTIDRIQVEISTNIADVSRDFDKANSSVSILTSGFDKVETSSKKATSRIDDFGNVALSTSKTSTSLESAVSKVTSSLSGIGSTSSSVSSSLEKVTGTVKESATSFNILDNAVSLVSKALSATAIVGGIITVGTACYNASIEVQTLTSMFESLYSATTDANEKLLEYSNTLSGVKGDRNIVDSVSTAVDRAFGSLRNGDEVSQNYLNSLAQLITDYQTQFKNINGATLTDNLAKLIDKWELDYQDADTILTQLAGVANQMHGADVGTNLSNLVSSLASNYGTYKGAMGYSFDEALQVALSIDEGYKDLSAGVAAIDKEYKYIDNIVKDLDSYIQLEETRYESAVSTGDTASATKSAALIKKYKDMEGKTSQEILREIFTDADAEFLSPATAGSSKDLANSIKKAVMNKGDYAEFVSNAAENEKLKHVETFGEWWSQFTDTGENAIGYEAISRSVEDSMSKVSELVETMSDDNRSVYESLVESLDTSAKSLGLYEAYTLRGENSAGSVGTVNPNQFYKEVLAEYYAGAMTESDVDTLLGKVNLSFDTLTRYLSDSSVSTAEEEISNYAAQRKAYTGEDLSAVPVEDLLEMLPLSITNTLESYQSIDESAADDMVTKISTALSEHDITLYYKLVDELIAAVESAGGEVDTESKERSGLWDSVGNFFSELFGGSAEGPEKESIEPTYYAGLFGSGSGTATEEAVKNIEDLGNTSEAATPQIQTLADTGMTPLATSVQAVCDNVSNVITQDAVYIE